MTTSEMSNTPEVKLPQVDFLTMCSPDL